MSTDWTQGAGEQGSKRGGFLGDVRATDGSQGLARRQKGGREALQAPCYFCGSPRQAAQLTQ